MKDEQDRSRAFGEFMRDRRIDAIKRGEIEAEPGELKQSEELLPVQCKQRTVKTKTAILDPLASYFLETPRGGGCGSD